MNKCNAEIYWIELGGGVGMAHIDTDTHECLQTMYCAYSAHRLAQSRMTLLLKYRHFMAVSQQCRSLDRNNETNIGDKMEADVCLCCDK